MVDAAVKVEGLKEFQKGLKAADKDIAKQFTKKQREIAQMLAPQAAGAAPGMGGAAGHFAHMIKGRGTAAGARIEIAPKANAAFWGASKRTGWNAGNGGAPQHRPWVGAGWEPGGAGGPYAINSTIRENLPQIEEKCLDAIDDATRRAFPDGGSR